ncbi:MAG: regulatory protein NosR [Magnetospirillum sp.]|nr:regulatory protein NosR [Magnetospirillum sp.]
MALSARVGLALLFILLVWPRPSRAEAILAQLLPELPLAQVFPGAERLGPVEGRPPAAVAYRGDTPLGTVFVTSDAVDTRGYSGKPIHVAVGIDRTGTIVGATLLKHSEPIVLIGIPPAKVEAFIAGFVGRNPLNTPQPADAKGPDVVSGATVTVMVIADTITRAAIVVARSRGLGGEPLASPPSPAVDRERAGSETWAQLVADGSVARLHLTVGEVNRAFAAGGDPRAAERPEAGADDDTVVDLAVALVSAPVIGRSLLGERGYRDLAARLPEGGQAILVMGAGRTSWRGSGYVRGGIFDRIQLIQDVVGIRFRDRDYERVGSLAAEDAPAYTEIGLFVLPPGADFDPARPWRLQLLVQRPVGALEKAFLTFDLPYRLPERWLAAPPPPPPAAAVPAPEPLWQRVWQAKAVEIGILAAALGVLTAIFFFQDVLVRRPRLTAAIRLGFLAFTLLWLGWYADAQLSVVNILALSNAFAHGFSWDTFLMDPLLFILWSAVAASLLFWGRGAFCGWLCPFGALQEFASLAARRMKIPQLTVPWGLHERLWPLKYVIFLGLFGVGLHSLATAERLAEVEPFKTAIILKFVRHWPFVLYAGVLLAAGLFVERFFCRYLCPLGAALAIPARLRMFEWLKRHNECGKPCQRCANECPVQAIHPDGRINPNECISCLHCQTLYWDQHRCPVMIQRRLKRERRDALSTPLGEP